MDLSFNTMRFGPKKQRIKIIHLRKPVTKGLAGMVMGKPFAQSISLVVDRRPRAEMDYNYMCLSHHADSKSIEIWMERDAFFGIKRGEPMARMSLFHELGHYYHKHLWETAEELSAYDKAREQAAKNGQVIQAELDADQFAADYLGRDYVIRGLSEMRAELVKECSCDKEQHAIALKELDLRIESLQRLSAL